MKVLIKTTAAWEHCGERLLNSGRLKDIELVSWEDYQGTKGTTVSFEFTEKQLFKFSLATNYQGTSLYHLLSDILWGLDELGAEIGCRARLSGRIVEILDEDHNSLYSTLSSLGPRPLVELI